MRERYIYLAKVKCSFYEVKLMSTKKELTNLNNQLVSS